MHGRSRRGSPRDKRSTCSRSRARGRERRARNRGLAAQPCTEVADFLDQVVMEDVRSRRLARRFRLRDIVGRAERQRLETDLRVAAGQRRGPDDDEIALLRQQLRQRGDAVELGHFDIEHGNVGVDAFDLVDRLEPGTQRRRDLHVTLGTDPARDQTTDDDGVIDDHHPQRSGFPRRARGRITCERNTHYSPTQTETVSGKQTPKEPFSLQAVAQIRPTSWNFAVTMSLSKGFMMYSLAPACSARAICATSFSVVQNTTLGWSPPGMRRRWPRNS